MASTTSTSGSSTLDKFSIPLTDSTLTSMLSIGNQALDAGLLHGGTPQAIQSLNKEKLYQYFYTSLQHIPIANQFSTPSGKTSTTTTTSLVGKGNNSNSYTNVQLSSYFTPIIDAIAKNLVENVSIY